MRVHRRLEGLSLLVLAFAGAALACAGPRSDPEGAPPRAVNAPAPPSRDSEGALAAVAFVHGGAGPWAVAGYRMGQAALGRLGLVRQSFDLSVVHHTPEKVQFSCMADGATAATGASVGKLNLKLVDAADADVQTTYVNRATGKALTLRPTAAFRARFADVPRAGLAAAGDEVMALPDAAIFEDVVDPLPSTAPPSRTHDP